jgi:hypothetical protein
VQWVNKTDSNNEIRQKFTAKAFFRANEYQIVQNIAGDLILKP